MARKPGFSISINPDELKKVEKALSGLKQGYETVVSTALNKTIKSVRTDSIEEIKKTITAGKQAIMKTFVIKKATKKKLSASVISTAKSIPLIKYKTKQTTKDGVTSQIYVGGKIEKYPHCFIAKPKNGKPRNVYSRFKPPYRTKASNKLPWRRFGKKFWYPVKIKYGPTVPDIMKRDKVMNPILAKAEEHLTKQIGVSLNWQMGKL